MPFFIILLILSTLLEHDFLLNNLAILINSLHNFCLISTPDSSHWQFIYEGLVCGAKLNKHVFLERLKLTGLYHLIVVSGTHINILESYLSTFLKRSRVGGRTIIYILVFLFCLTCQLKPPVTRAFVSLGLSHLNQKFKWNWPNPYRVFASGSLCLFLFPTWWSSHSLILSWASALFISFPLKSRFKQCGLVYLGLYPLFLSIQPLSPFTVASNWILAPILSLVAFPLTLLSYLVPKLSTFTDFFWDITDLLLIKISPLFEFSLIKSPSVHYFPWIYLLGVFFLLFLKVEVWRK